MLDKTIKSKSRPQSGYYDSRKANEVINVITREKSDCSLTKEKTIDKITTTRPDSSLPYSGRLFSGRPEV